MQSLGDLLAIWAAPLTMLVISAFYFWASPLSAPPSSRLLVSAHGVAGALLFLAGFGVAWLGGPQAALREPFLALWLVPIVLAIFSVVRFAGPRRTHWLLVPLLAAMLWACAVSFTVVGGGK
jgi:hypothetical protein